MFRILTFHYVRVMDNVGVMDNVCVMDNVLSLTLCASYIPNNNLPFDGLQCSLQVINAPYMET